MRKQFCGPPTIGMLGCPLAKVLLLSVASGGVKWDESASVLSRD